MGLDFLDMPTAASGHDFLQVHIDFLTGRVWLVPTHKTATAATAATNFVGSVFRDVGLPDVDTRGLADTPVFSIHGPIGVVYYAMFGAGGKSNS